MSIMSNQLSSTYSGQLESAGANPIQKGRQTALSIFKNLLAFGLFAFLLLGFGLPSTVMAQQTVLYKITTVTGNNGMDKPVFILMNGTLGAVDDPIVLDNAGVDDFKHGATDVFVIEALDIGVITDIMLKAHPKDYWKVDRISIERLGLDGKPLAPVFTSVWDRNFPNLIDGDFPKGKNRWTRATNIARPTTELAGQGVDVIIRQEALIQNNLNNTDGTDKCGNMEKTVLFSEAYQTEQSTTTSFTATFGGRIMAGVPDVFEVEASFGFEVATSMSQAFSNTVTQDKGDNYNKYLCASPGTIKFDILTYVETRQYGEVSFLGGKEKFYKVIGARWISSEGYVVRTYEEVDAYLANPSSDPELANAIRLTPSVERETITPRPKSLPAISFGNNTGSGATSAQSGGPSTGNTSTSQETSQNDNDSAETSVTVVECSDGNGNLVGYFKFKKGTGKWVETDAVGKTKFTYELTGKEDQAIHLRDVSRSVDICLELDLEEVLYSDSNNTTPFSIYTISDAY